MKKKLRLIACALTLAFLLGACGGEPAESPEEQAKHDFQPSEFQPGLDWSLALVSEDYPAGDYEPELEEVQDHFKMDARMAGTMRLMLADAKAQGVELKICSAYRPYSSQERNFQNSVNVYVNAGLSKEEAISRTRRLIAYPGTSEHQSGLAADIVSPYYQKLDAGFAKTKASKWLLENAAGYGFILRYPADKTEITGFDYEPWHYRYVGVEAATEITSRGICLEEYLGVVEEQEDG